MKRAERQQAAVERFMEPQSEKARQASCAIPDRANHVRPELVNIKGQK